MYHILFVFLIILGYILINQSASSVEIRKNRYIVYVCVILILQSSLRNLAVGADTYAYSLKFENEGSWSWSEIWANFYYVYIMGEGKDAGYPLLEKLFNIVCPDFRLFLTVLAVFFFTAWGKLLQRYTHTMFQVFAAVGLYLLLFYSFTSITGCRQTIGIAFSMYAFLAMENKKWFWFIMCLIPAFFIHKSAGCILLIPMLYNWKKVNELMVLAFIGFLFAVFNRGTLVNVFREVAEYEVYKTSLPYSLMLFYFMLSLFSYCNVKKCVDKDFMIKIFNLYIPTFIMIPLLGWDSLFMRQSLYFSIYITILAPFFLEEMRRGRNQILSYSMVVFFYLYYIVTAGEYRFFWEYMPLGSNYQ